MDNSKKKIYITGMGALTASGKSVDAMWASVLGGVQGIAPITQWDIQSWPNGALGGEILPYEPAKLLPDRKLLKLISKQDVFGIHAAVQAVEDSGLIPYRDGLSSPDEFNDKTAVFVASPGNKYLQQYDFLPLIAQSKGNMQAFAEHLSSTVHPMWLLRILPNNVLAYTGMTYGFKGVNHNFTNHAVGGAQAIIEAYHAISQGFAERAVVVGYDMGTEPQALYYYKKLGVISDRFLAPFDAGHDGTVLAEGAAAIVLESEASVLARKARCYGEVVGGMSETEAAGLFSIEASGKALADLCSLVLQKNNVSVEHVAMIAAHGNGNPQSDLSEARAIQKIFAQSATLTTAFKWAMGHTLCASGIVDTILLCKSLQEGVVPGVANLTTVANGCEGVYVAAQNRAFNSDKSYGLLMNRGFASINACLLVKHCG